MIKKKFITDECGQMTNINRKQKEILGKKTKFGNKIKFTRRVTKSFSRTINIK